MKKYIRIFGRRITNQDDVSEGIKFLDIDITIPFEWVIFVEKSISEIDSKSHNWIAYKDPDYRNRGTYIDVDSKLFIEIQNMLLGSSDTSGDTSDSEPISNLDRMEIDL